MADNRLPFVVSLADVRAEALSLGGGKAANLSKLLRWGFPVPPGFVITTAAYDEVVAQNELGQVIAAVSQPDGPEKLRTGFARAAMPPDLERDILDAYRKLGAGAVAVRSSATAEDLPEAAFAGQQETYLGIQDEAALLEAVRRCWASLWGDRAIAYRAHHGLAGMPVKLAVIVQRMVPADAAGVLFTANPITGARDETVIEASAGLGEAIVSGLVTPDHYLLRHARGRWRIVERNLGRREIEVRSRAGGGTEQIAGETATTPALPDRVLRQLARMGDSIARRFGRPQDIEWAWAEGDIVVLQSRPITALPDSPAQRGRSKPPAFGADYVQVRPYPLDVTTWLAAVGKALPRMFPIEGLIPAFDEMLIEKDGVVERIEDFPGFHFAPRMLLAPAQIVSLALRYDPANWRNDDTLQAYLRRVRDLEDRDLASLSWEELLATAREALAMPAAIVEVRRRYFPRGALALAALRLLLAPLGESRRFDALLSGIDNATLQANRALEALAAEIRADPDLTHAFQRQTTAEIASALTETEAGRAFLERLDRFLDAYGHRETGSPLLVSQPTWKDAPQTVLGILQGLARAAPPQRAKQGKRDWEIARDAVLAHPIFRVPGARSAFLAILDEARRVFEVREDTHFALTMPMPILRRTLLELGRRLVQVGVLNTAEDVFHLRFDELERIAGTWPPAAGLAAKLRVAARERAARREALADTPMMDLQAPHRSLPAGDALVAGTPGSPGVAEGPVRVVRDAGGFGSLLPGEVLVAPYTNPSWTPIFPRAAAIVVDTGAAMSHAAIVAREYGLPAVMGTGDATRRLSDGRWVRVDGSRGLVFPATPSTDAAPHLAAGAEAASPEIAASRA